MRKDLRERLKNEWVFCDGGMGTILQSKGLKGGELPETWNLSRPDDILELHCDYLKAGATIFNTNTFGANRLKYPDNLKEIVEAAVALTQKARTLCGREEDAYIALDIGPTGKLLEPLGDLPFETAVSIFSEVIQIGVAAGVDLILIETMSDSYEAKAAVLAAKENCDLPVLITTIYDEKGKLLTGGTVASTVTMLEGLGVDALGVNCGLGPKQMMPIIRDLTAIATVPVIVNPNAGLPRNENGATVFDVGPEEFATYMEDIADLGVHILGGCCGTTPEHIRQTIKQVTTHQLVTLDNPRVARISSYCEALEIGPHPLIVGERINPTGKKVFKQALRDQNFEYILSEGLRQEESGAHILDVNVGLPEIDEPYMMEEVVTRLQSITSLPLQIDTTDIEAMERGLRYYNGKALINSVNGKQENMDAVFPLVQKYGGVVIALALDEDGIPESSDGRIAIAKKIYAEAAKYGIPQTDIVVDGLCMTISSDTNSANVTLDTIRRIRDELHGNSILGVSNISFGLPHREIINSFFYTMAMQNGLSLAIINPGNEPMMRAYYGFMALTNQDPQCGAYIDRYAQVPADSMAAITTNGVGKATTGDLGLIPSIEKGMKESAVAAVTEELKQRDPLAIINEDMIPALDIVGKGFEKGTVFLPQLLMSAEAAKAAFDVIKDAMKDTKQESKGKVILATVKGDIHDIGKNIVKVLLDNYGFEVIDLGKDVPPEVIVDTAINQNVELVGLSALMTTTVVSMEETIQLLKEKKPGTKTVVGGAVMTQEYADSIGADCYAKDAMATVNYANSILCPNSL
ncbi:MAG: homocysteine S-methyltransferase family protein [Lachnospiraceae bacterium]|nr:homocysteine S-methyltransferase family protein [Lachnospiraceae bacterium]